MSSTTCTPSRSLSAWATSATLPTSVRMSTYALSIPAALLGVRPPATLWPDRWLLVGGGRLLHKAGQPAATRPGDLCGIVGAGGGGGQPLDRHGQPPAATGTAAWHTHLDSGHSRREGPDGPGEGGEPCRSGGS